MKKSKEFTVLKFGTVALIMLCFAQMATAGNKASVAPNGVGKVEASISYNGVLIEAKEPATGVFGTVSSTRPAAGVFNVAPAGFPTTGNFESAALPAGCPSTVYCTITTTYVTGGYKAVARASLVAGAVADNPELELKIPIAAAPCAFFNVTTEFSDGKLKVEGESTDGTAIWVRALQYKGTNASPSSDELKTNSELKGELVLAGPFNTSLDGCPFTVPVSGDTNTLYILFDTLAKSEPYVMTCQDVVLECGAVASYPAPSITGGCVEGETAAVSYSIAAGALPLGVPTLVTATATKDGGTIATCQFTATVGSLTFVGFYAPIGTGGNTCANTTVTANKGSNTPLKFDLKCGTSYITQGITPIVTIQEFNNNCVATGINLTAPATYQNDWHINWDTSSTKKNYKYRVSVSVNGIELGYVFIKIK